MTMRAATAPTGIHGALGALAGAAAFVLLLGLVFGFRWETNDDVAMSMVAHGYGIAATGMPNIVFSNVLWGHLVRLLPSIGGITGYSLATLAVLIVTWAALAHGLVRAGSSYLVAVAAAVLLFTRPVLFPQFTLNAGLLMVAAIVCWYVYARHGALSALVAGCLLAFFSYLVRGQECMLVFLVGLPLLPARALVQQRAGWIAALILAAAIGASALIDRNAYAGADWADFRELNPIRAQFTDFGAGAQLKQHPEIYQRHGYSLNDIDLVENWFFADPAIADPAVLRDMLAELGPLPEPGIVLGNVRLGIQALWHPSLVVLVLAALLLAALRPGWRVAASWGLCLAAIVAFALLGRPAVLRVYQPMIALLAIAPLLQGAFTDWRRRLAMAALAIAALINAAIAMTEAQQRGTADAGIRQALAGFPAQSVLVWGAAFPFEAAFPVLGATDAAMSYRLAGLGVFATAPISVAYAEQAAGRGPVARLKSAEGLQVIATDQRIGYLEIYCRERLRGTLTDLGATQFGDLTLRHLRCATAP